MRRNGEGVVPICYRSGFLSAASGGFPHTFGTLPNDTSVISDQFSIYFQMVFVSICPVLVGRLSLS